MTVHDGLSDLEVLGIIITIMKRRGNLRFNLYYKEGKWQLTVE